MPDTPQLLEPWTLRNGLLVRNAVVLAPMTNKQSHADGTLSQDELTWLTRRAQGGIGMMMTCASHVAKDGQGWPGELGIFDEAHVPGLSRLALALREHGAASIVQIFHGGIRADASVSGSQPWGPSAIDGAREATHDDIARVIDQFAAAAKRAHRAGFDGVEIHGAHGYLLCQFLSTTLNQRDDTWGGSLEHRAKLLRAVTQAVRAEVPASFTISVRISPENFGNAKGLDLDESLQLARWIADDGADLLHISLWRAGENSAKYPDKHPVPLFVQAVGDRLDVVVAGSIWTRQDAQHQLEMGARAVAIGRSAIVNPDWAQRVGDPDWSPVRPPVSMEHLAASGLGPAFAEYMRNWKDFVR